MKKPLPKHETMLLGYILHHVCIYDIMEHYGIEHNVIEAEERCSKYMVSSLIIDNSCKDCIRDWLKEDL